jgi:hypothetical protein
VARAKDHFFPATRPDAGDVTIGPGKDPINPAHYKTASGMEAIQVIEAFDLGFCLGNAVKYILRAGKKDPGRTVEDLEKAQWYIERRLGIEKEVQKEGKGTL